MLSILLALIIYKCKALQKSTLGSRCDPSCEYWAWICCLQKKHTCSSSNHEPEMSSQCCWLLPPPCPRYGESRLGTCEPPTCLHTEPRKRGEPRVAGLKASAKAGRALHGPSSATRGCQEASVVCVRRRSWRRVSSGDGRPVALECPGWELLHREHAGPGWAVPGITCTWLLCRFLGALQSSVKAEGSPTRLLHANHLVLSCSLYQKVTRKAKFVIERFKPHAWRSFWGNQGISLL